VDVGEGYLAFGQPSNCVVAVLKGKKHLLHRNRHRVFGKSCPSHGLGFFSVEDVAEQYPIYPKGGNGFGMVRGEASGTRLADVHLPTAEIGGGWFHRFGFSNAKLYTN